MGGSLSHAEANPQATLPKRNTFLQEHIYIIEPLVWAETPTHRTKVDTWSKAVLTTKTC